MVHSNFCASLQRRKIKKVANSASRKLKRLYFGESSRELIQALMDNTTTVNNNGNNNNNNMCAGETVFIDLAVTFQGPDDKQSVTLKVASKKPIGRAEYV